MESFSSLESTLDDITKIVSEYHPDADSIFPRLKEIYDEVVDSFDDKKLQKAIRIGTTTHIKQTRHSGEPFFAHPCRTAYLAGTLTHDSNSVYINILHDSIEDSENPDLTRLDILENMGVDMLLGVSGMGTLKNPVDPNEKATLQYMRIQYFYQKHGIDLEPTKIADVVDNLLTLDSLRGKGKTTAGERQKAYCDVARKYVLPMCGRFDSTHEDIKITPYFESLLKEKENNIIFAYK